MSVPFFCACTARGAPLRCATAALVWLASCAFVGSAQAQAVATTTGISLPSVTIYGTRFSDRLDNVPFGVSVLTGDELRGSGAATVNEAVMKLLGVPGRADLYGGGEYGLDLRGFGGTADSNQVLIVDGVRINEADLGGSRLAGIPIDTVERIEVIRGSGSVLYGEGATGGVIVVTTRAGLGLARETQGAVVLAAGSLGLREGRAGGTFVDGDISIDADLHRRDADNHRDNFHTRSEGWSTTAQWRTDGLRAGARFSADHLKGGLPGALSAAEVVANPRQSNTPTDAASIDNHRTGVFAEASLGSWDFGLDAGWRDKALQSTRAGAITYAYDVAARSLGWRARHTGGIGAAVNSLVAGIDLDHWQRVLPGAFGSVAHQRARALYVKDELSLPGDTRMSLGWRTGSIRKDITSAVAGVHERPQAWELGLVRPLTANAAVFGRYGQSFRLANVDEIGYTAPGKALAPQTSRDAEAGVRWKHPGGRGEVRAYRSALRNELGFDPDVTGPDSPAFNGANVNFDPTHRRGIELELTQGLGAAAHLRLNLASRRASFVSGPHAGKDVPLTPRYSAALQADWSPASGHRLDAGVSWVASQHPDFANACTMPSYATASARYAVQWGLAELSVGVNNLTDKHYYTQAFVCTAGVVQAIYPEAGRTAVVAARFNF